MTKVITFGNLKYLQLHFTLLMSYYGNNSLALYQYSYYVKLYSTIRKLEWIAQ